MDANLKTLTDQQLVDLIKQANKEADHRKREKERVAKEAIRKIASDVDLKVSFTEGKAPRKTRKKKQTEEG